MANGVHKTALKGCPLTHMYHGHTKSGLVWSSGGGDRPCRARLFALAIVNDIYEIEKVIGFPY